MMIPRVVRLSLQPQPPPPQPIHGGPPPPPTLPPPLPEEPSNQNSDPFQPDMPKVFYNFTSQFSNLDDLKNALNINEVDSTFLENYNTKEKEFYANHRPESEVYSNSKIRTIMDWKKKVYKSTVFKYYEYTIERKDGTISIFTDSELPHLHPYDLRFLLVYFGKKFDMGVECKDALMRVRKALKDYIEKLSLTDVELCRCFGGEDWEMENPDTEIDGIEGYKNGMIIQEPEFGVICEFEGEKRFFRLSEVRKFDDLKLGDLVDVVLNIEDLDENSKGYLVEVICGHVSVREWVKECKKKIDYYK